METVEQTTVALYGEILDEIETIARHYGYGKFTITVRNMLQAAVNIFKEDPEKFRLYLTMTNENT